MQQVIIITGASSGFGKATAEMLAAKGNTVYGLCRRHVLAESNIKYYQCDVRDRGNIRANAEKYHLKILADPRNPVDQPTS